ncbi:MAG: NCS2 family permease [Planctomycetota bacterium]|nr:NCS2 family permease [Planctomycetota bacterium]
MFRLREHGTTVGAEIRGGLVTFLTLSYILFVQPAVLSAVGMPRNDVFVATCVCSALACFLMGILTNYPFALAPAMGHNFFFAFMVCSALGFGFLWPEALLANLIAGAIFLCLSFVGLREAIMQAVPESLKYAIAVGIGLLIAFVGLQYGDIVQNSPAVLVRLGDLANPVVLVVLAGIAVTAVLTTLQFRGAILGGILATAILAVVLGRVAYHQPDGLECITEGQFLERAGITRGAVDATVPVPPGAVRVVLAEPRPSESLLGRVVALPHWPHETLGAVFRKPLDLFRNHSLADVLLVIFIFFFLDMFDTVGTLIGVSERAGFLDEKGQLPRARWALFSDAAGTVMGAIVGTSTITTYVESAAGVKEGARTGLAAIVTGVLLLLALVFAPLVEMVGMGVHFIHAETGETLRQVVAGTPVEIKFYPVIAPVLVVIGVMMMGSVRKIRWEDYDEAIPAFLTIVVMQFSFSITDGIAWGFISYVLLKLVTRRAREIHGLVALFAALFVGMYVARAFLTGS